MHIYILLIRHGLCSLNFTFFPLPHKMLYIYFFGSLWVGPDHPHVGPASICAQGDFLQKCRLIRERLDSRESETLGKWMTEETMRKSGLYSPTTITSMISYCRKFPESLMRPLVSIWNAISWWITKTKRCPCMICLIRPRFHVCMSHPCRPWRYNDQVDEFYIIYEDKSSHKKAETLREQDETDLGESWLHAWSRPFIIGIYLDWFLAWNPLS